MGGREDGGASEASGGEAPCTTFRLLQIGESVGVSSVRCSNCGLLKPWERIFEAEMEFSTGSRHRSIYLTYCKECVEALTAFLRDAYPGDDHKGPKLYVRAY